MRQVVTGKLLEDRYGDAATPYVHPASQSRAAPVWIDRLVSLELAGHDTIAEGISKVRVEEMIQFSWFSGDAHS